MKVFPHVPLLECPVPGQGMRNENEDVLELVVSEWKGKCRTD